MTTIIERPPPVGVMSVRYTCGDCGYARAYRSTAMADYHHPKHSCAKELTKQAAHRRGRARRAAVDRTPKPCLHKIAEHQHGTHACYTLDACRCPPCAAAETVYERRRIRDRAYGREAFVDAAPARDHARALMAAGMGLKRIVVVSGVAQGTLWKLLYGKRKPDGTKTPSKRITRETETRLLAVEVNLSTLAAGAPIDATGTHRRVQALVTIGWSLTKVGQLVDMDCGNFWSMMQRPRVTAGHARAIADLYERLWNTPPPQDTHHEKISASRARRYAADRGWLPPLAWDDDTIDDPNATPAGDTAEPVDLDEVLVQRIIAGAHVVPLHTQRSLELIEAVRILAHRRYSDAQIGRTVGRSRDAVCKIREREGIPTSVPPTRALEVSA